MALNMHFLRPSGLRHKTIFTTEVTENTEILYAIINIDTLIQFIGIRCLMNQTLMLEELSEANSLAWIPWAESIFEQILSLGLE
jgi:hypothetical protein